MKKTLITAIVLCLGLICLGAEGKTKINIIMKAQADATELARTASFFPNKEARRDFVVSTLKQQAETSQFELIGFLKELENNGLVEEIRPLWIVNSVSCYADENVIHELELRNDILMVYPCEELPLMDDFQAIPADRGDGREIAENLLQVNADRVWELGYTGEGILIAIIDTGVRLTHADLQGRFWDGGDEYPNHGYDFANHDNNPTDQNGHGTHVAGTICGTGVSGTQTGVAPGAKLMVLKVFGNDQQTDETILVEAMQFAMEHGADVLNMSLGWPDPSVPIRLLYRQACDNTLAAGIVASVCAGNIRHMQYIVPVPHNIYAPGDCPPPYLHEDQMVNSGGVSCVISVGAVDSNNAIAYFSSEGPSTWTDVTLYNDYPYNPENPTEIGLIRPDICAPGMNIKSLDFNNDNGYCLMEGTSMATPCVSGAIALMLSKNPELTPAQIDEILERTAVHLSEHKSNDFGSGLLDALAAVNAVNYDDITESHLNAIVYPNPIIGDFTITAEGIKSVSMYSVEGRLLKTIEVNGNECRLEGLSNGIYLLKINTINGIIMNKIVKM